MFSVQGLNETGETGGCTRLLPSHRYSWQKVIGIPYILGDSSSSSFVHELGEGAFLKNFDIRRILNGIFEIEIEIERVDFRIN